MNPHQPPPLADPTTASVLRFPTHKQIRTTKQVDNRKFPLLWFYVVVLTKTCLNVPAPLFSVVSQPADEGNGLPAGKRRRVTAEMEGKYIINMPQGTTPRTRRLLAQQAKKGRPDPVGLPTKLPINPLIKKQLG